MTASTQPTAPHGRSRHGRPPHGRTAIAAAGIAAGVALVPAPAAGAMLGGERIARQPVTLDVPGPPSSETDTAPNPFLDVRLDATFTSPSGIAHRVPGFFAGNGLGHGTGDVWRARFTPDEPGLWRWSVDFDAGVRIAVTDAPGRPLTGDGADGTFEIAMTDPTAPGFLGDGALVHGDDGVPRTADGERWLRGGIAGPSNFFGYAGFDGTVDLPGGAPTPGLVDGLHRYAAHVDDWREGDPDFSNEVTGIDGRGIVGAVNHLADRGVNSIRISVMNLGGDGRDTHPFLDASAGALAAEPADGAVPSDDVRYDVSRLHQWGLVLDHMQARGVGAHLVLAEPHHDNLNRLDGGRLGTERRLHHRELVARFGHLNALRWSLGAGGRLDPAREAEFARHLRGLDGDRHPIAVHAPGAPDMTPEPSASSGPDAATAARRDWIYPSYLGGGQLEWRAAAAPASPLDADVTTEDFRTHEPVYRAMRIARELVRTYLPLERAAPDDAALSEGDPGDRVLSVPGEVHALYLPTGGGSRVLATDRAPSAASMGASPGAAALPEARWEIAWFDPRTGRFEGERRVAAGPSIALGEPPSTPEGDWVVLVRRVGAAPGTGPADAPPVAAAANPMAHAEAGVTATAATAAEAGDSPASPGPVAAAPGPDGQGVARVGGGAASWLLGALVLAGRRCRSRKDAIRLVYFAASIARPGPCPCRPSR